MKGSPKWQYDEMQQVGKDYANVSEVEKYDVFHKKFRNVEKENEAILNMLSVQKHHIVLEFGTGTGSFAIQAAKCCGKVYAVDVSQTMLDYAKNKAITNEVTNITFCHGGFLTYKHHKDALVDFVVTSTASPA
jgi:ubiquinone/menaquinone biosynthesis C-methylase UbiE